MYRVATKVNGKASKVQNQTHGTLLHSELHKSTMVINSYD